MAKYVITQDREVWFYPNGYLSPGFVLHHAGCDCVIEITKNTGEFTAHSKEQWNLCKKYIDDANARRGIYPGTNNEDPLNYAD